MISQIVFDLPLDGPFDYLIPEHLAAQVAVGKRAKVSFGPGLRTGFVVGIIPKSAIPKLKPIQSLVDASVVFDDHDLTFAREFCTYYGCSLGQALATVMRNKQDLKPSVSREGQPQLALYRCRPDKYSIKIKEIIDGYRRHSKEVLFLVLVPDQFKAQALSRQLESLPVTIGTRSSVFECDGRFDCVFMIDDENASYKQEQMPMYETRQVLLARSSLFGFDIAFVGISPSIELITLVHEHKVKLFERADDGFPKPRLVDLTNYKFIPGLVSPPVRDALEASLKSRQKSILVLNRRGSYRLTRCVDCGEILKCHRCDSPLYFSKAEGKYLCRHCTYSLPGQTACPKCQKPSWRSVGIGVEQVKTELKKIFPQAKIVSFEREARPGAKNAPGPGDFDILISTQAVLRFQGQWQAATAAFIDFDAELNRLDMRCAFNAYSLALHVSCMATNDVFIQTRFNQHYMLQSLCSNHPGSFYGEELKLRKEFGFSPFKHWIKLSWRGKSEKSTHQAASRMYNDLIKTAPEHMTITPVLVDSVGRKRDQFRFNLMVQADEVALGVAFIRATLAKTKRQSRVITTINVDP